MLALQTSRVAVRGNGLGWRWRDATNTTQTLDGWNEGVTAWEQPAAGPSAAEWHAPPSPSSFVQAPAKVQVAQRRQVVVCAVQQQQEAVPRRAALGLLAAAGERRDGSVKRPMRPV